MLAQASLDAHLSRPGRHVQWSRQAGWRSLLLHSTVNPPEVGEVVIPPTPDLHIVMVTAGECQIESGAAGQRRRAHYRVGDLGMTAPGHEDRLRWTSARSHTTLHLHLPAHILHTARAELGPDAAPMDELPNVLRRNDAAIVAVMCALERAAQHGIPERYAETAAQFLAVHLLSLPAYRKRPEPSIQPLGPAAALRVVDEMMHANLAAPITLEQLAQAAGLSPFQMLRAAKSVWHETPMRRLNRLRLQLARQLLGAGGLPIIEIAARCGYSNPSHFATAFRRAVGMTPTQYQKSH